MFINIEVLSYVLTLDIDIQSCYHNKYNNGMVYNAVDC